MANQIANEFQDDPGAMMYAGPVMLRRPDVEPGFCFVLMPLRSSFDASYAVIKRSAKKLNLDCKRADEIYGTRRFMSDIWESIWKARIIIADLTQKNPNVNYELGLCHALNVPTVLITQKPADVPSDYRDHRYILYKPKEKGWERKLDKKLRETIGTIVNETVPESDLPWPHGAELMPYRLTRRKLVAKESVQTVVLHEAKVPFSQGQNADFCRATLPKDATGFKVTIHVPDQPYWRVGFALAPVDYITEGRSDIAIQRYFLFHIGRGSSARPTEPEKLRYMAYYQGEIVKHLTQFESAEPVIFDVSIQVSSASGAVLSVSFDAVRYEIMIDASYLKYLYILAWADKITTFRVPIELKLQ